MRRPKVPRPRINLLSGHHAARWWLRAAFAVVFVALLVLLWATPKPTWAPWPTFLSPPQIEIAAAWVAFFGVLAAVIAIVAAYIEVRTVFPTQELTAYVTRGPTQTWFDASWVRFENKRGNALVNAYRLEVRLESPSEQFLYGEADEHGWSRVMSVDDTSTPWYHWAISRDSPLFPGTAPVEGPAVAVEHEDAYWRATWWTDRGGPECRSPGALSHSSPRALDHPGQPVRGLISVPVCVVNHLLAAARAGRGAARAAGGSSRPRSRSGSWRWRAGRGRCCRGSGRRRGRATPRRRGWR